jgi:hypothetical protein
MFETETIFVLVGKRVRQAEARFNRSRTVAIVDTSSGPVEFRRWYSSAADAQAAINFKQPLTMGG